MINACAIFIGGGLGALSRYGITISAVHFFAKSWPGTLVANCVGTTLIFIFANHDLKEGESLFIKTGILGALTTFSTFCLEVVTLFKAGSYKEAALCFFLNVIFGVVIGIWLLQKKII